MLESAHPKAKAKENQRSQAKVRAKATKKGAKGKAKVEQSQTKGRAKAKQHLNTKAIGHAEAHTLAETVRKDQHHQVRSEACPVFKR